LLYPLISPFLPPVDKVESGYSYANNSLVGTLPGGIEYSKVMGLNGTYAQALYYASHLEADGETISETELNLWRIPTQGELCKLIADSVADGIGPTFGFNHAYWSASEHDETQNWYAYRSTNMIGVLYGDKTASRYYLAVK
jgi:hypothetical protein